MFQNLIKHVRTGKHAILVAKVAAKSSFHLLVVLKFERSTYLFNVAFYNAVGYSKGLSQ